MLRLIVLVQLVLWVVSSHAFFIWFPSYLCDKSDKSHICPDFKRSISDRSARDGEAIAPGVTYPLVRRAAETDGELPAAIAARAARRLGRKYSRWEASMPPGQSRPRTRRDNTYTILPAATPSQSDSLGVDQDGTDFTYFIKIGMGSAQKQMYMLLDTGAGTTWVMGSGCQSTACTMHTTFGSADSTTYQDTAKTFSIAYGSGTVSGQLAQDSFSVAGVKVTSTFGVANQTSDDFTHFPFDGILGLSMSKGATDNFLQVLKDQKLLKTNVFAVSISRASDGPNDGEITFGGVDATKYTGTLSYSAVASSASGDWAMSMDDLSYDNQKAGVAAKLAYLDTGTSYMFGPPSDVAALHKLIPGATSGDGVTFTVPCSTNLPVVVSFAAVTYTISAKDWVSAPSESGVCTSNIYGHEVVSGAWLLGDLFLKNVYTVFDSDQSRIGLAAKAPLPASLSTAGSSTKTAMLSTITAAPAKSTDSSSLPGVSGHETSATAGSPAAETSGPAPTQTVTSPGEQLEGNKYASIICMVAIIAMVA